MTGGGRLSQLLSLTKSLPKLSGGSTLRIKSPSPQIPLRVRLIPQWRNDGMIRLEQMVPPEKLETESNASKGTPLEGEVGFKMECKPGEKRGSDISIDVDFDKILFPSSSSTSRDETIEKHLEDVDDIEDDNISITLTAEIPENCNVSCEIQAPGDIDVTAKLEGEEGFDFFTKGGDITLKKLRGDSIRLATGRPNSDDKGGQIYVSKSCETQNLNMYVGKGGRIRAKMMNVSNADIKVLMGGADKDGQYHFQKLDEDDGLALIDMSSLYTSKTGDGAHLEVVPSSSENASDWYPRHTRIKSNHGHISVRSTLSSHIEKGSGDVRECDESLSLVELGGVNGSFDVAIDELKPNQVKEAVPCVSRVHIDSLFPSHISVLTCDNGDVNLTLDRKLEADLRLLSSPLLYDYDSNKLLEQDENEIVQSLVDHDDNLVLQLSENPSFRKVNQEDEDAKISLQIGSFDGRILHDTEYLEYAQGFVKNISEEPDSRFDVQTRGRQGKISIDGAAGQALEGFSVGNVSTDDSMIDIDKRPLVAIATNGKIKVESLSWLGAIARRYGISDESIELGRQARSGTRQ